MPTRRQFLQSAVAASVATAFAGRAFAADASAAEPKLKKAVKFDMIQTPGSIKDKFELVK
jgi:hypothetical protein